MRGRSTARARITGERCVRVLHTQKLNDGWLVFTRGGQRREVYTFWRYEVIDSFGKVVMRDGCSDYAQILDDAHSGVTAVRRLENAGHKIKYSFDSLVDGALDA